MSLFLLINPKQFSTRPDDDIDAVDGPRRRKRHEHVQALVVQMPEHSTKQLQNRLSAYAQVSAKQEALKGLEDIEAAARELERLAALKESMAREILAMEEEEGALLLLLLD